MDEATIELEPCERCGFREITDEGHCKVCAYILKHYGEDDEDDA
jgi:hypothetical protein